MGDGWYRLSLSVVPENHDGVQSVTIEPDRNATSKSVYVYGAMLNESTHTSTNITVTGYDSTFSGTGPKLWTPSNSSLVSVSGGKGVFNTDSNQNLKQFSLVTKGKKYRVQFDVEDYQSGSVKPTVPFSVSTYNAFTAASANGTYTFEGLAHSDTLHIQSVGATELKIDNVIVTELSDVVTPTYASTPVYTVSSDNTRLDTSDTIATTLGEFASSSDCHVVTWHDQGGGRQKDFIQENAAYQPRIVIAGSLVTDNAGKASVYFDGSDNLINSKLAGQKRLDAYVALDTNPKDTHSNVLLSSNDGKYGITFQNGESATSIQSSFGTPEEFIDGSLMVANATRDDFYDALVTDTHLLTLTNGSTSAFNTFQMGWHNAHDSVHNFAGKISEMVFFSNQDSSQKDLR